MSGAWRLARGATLDGDGATFTVWAPSARDVVLHVANGAARGDHALSPVNGEPGVLTTHVRGVRAGDRYGFCLDGGDALPDP